MALSAVGVRVRFGSHQVLDGIDLEIPAGQTVGLSGPSGGGKTTLARVLCGLLQPDDGQVLLDGVPRPARRGTMDGRVAMLFQSPRSSVGPRQRLGEVIAEPLRVRGHGRGAVASRVGELAAEVGLGTELLGRLPSQVSEGQLQRAALARALAQDPQYLICDEATAMLDPPSTARLVALIRGRTAQGLGVLAISHDTELLDAWAGSQTQVGSEAR